MKSLQFLPCWDFFGVKRTKNYCCICEFFEIFYFCFSYWGFSIWNSGWVLFWHKSPVFFWVICWHFLPFKRVFFTIFTFLGWKWTKIFLVMVNALKFWYLFKRFGLFYLEFCVGVFFLHIWPFFFCLIRWHVSPFKGQLLKIVTFLRFYFGENGQKITLVRVNPFIFLYFL